MIGDAGGRLSLSRRMAVLRYDNFRLLFIATLGSGIGTWMATIALTADITHRTESPWWVSVLLIVTFLPSIAVGLVAGPLIDRLSRKRLIVFADLARLVVFCALPFAGTPLAIVALAAVAGTANSFFRPAVLAGVPNLLPEEELAGGTSLLQATDWLATAAGPVLGGAIVSASGPHLVYWINAVTFLFSAVLLVRIPAGFLQSEQGITRGHWRDLAEGLGAFRHSRALFIVLAAFGLTMLGSGLINVSEIFLATRAFDSGAFGYGLLWTATGIGLVIGSLITAAILERREILAIYPFVFLPWAAGFVGAAVSPNVWIAALAMVVAGVGNGLTFPMTVLIIQQHTTDRIRGRAFTLIISAHNALLGVAMIAAGELTNVVGARWTYGVAGALTASGGITAYVLARGVSPQPAVAREQAA
ncbi:MAG TPA: MFS transporter [Gaiellaceae bacterium]|nr:MFS transporter [Gaiellaceae bacterium]